MTCTRCSGSGFLNVEQAPPEIADLGFDAIQEWRKTDDGEVSDVVVCDCCGDGEACSKQEAQS